MLGTIGYIICTPLSALLRLFYSLTGSYGVAIILFTLVIKLILLPFQMKSKKSMVRMSRMSGKTKELQKRYANDRAKLGEEMQKLYAEEGVNPMGGCIWGFIPMPLLIALFYIIREPIKYFMNFGSAAAGQEVVKAAEALIHSNGIELVTSKAYQQIEILKIIGSKFPEFAAQYPQWIDVDYSFLGLDLSVTPWAAVQGMTVLGWAVIGMALIPVVSGILNLFLSRLTMRNQPTAGGNSSKVMTLVMPLMSLYFGFMFPAALGIYWITQSAFSVAQEFFLGKYFNEKFQSEEDAYQADLASRREQNRIEAKRVAEEQRQQSAKQREKDAKRKKAEAARKAAKKKNRGTTNENGRVGERPYARGRAYREDRYDQ